MQPRAIRLLAKEKGMVARMTNKCHPWIGKQVWILSDDLKTNEFCGKVCQTDQEVIEAIKNMSELLKRN